MHNRVNSKAAQVFRNRPTIFKGKVLKPGGLGDLQRRDWYALGVSRHYFHRAHFAALAAQEVILEHHPGRPRIDLGVLPAAKILFVGDTLVINQPPFLAQAELGTWLESLDLLLKTYANFTIVSGRGGWPAWMISAACAKCSGYPSRIERLAAKNASPEATQEMVTLLAHYSFAAGCATCMRPA
jgi:hypothetical protein